MSEAPKIIVIGLGYVGLPLAVALARHFEVTGLDIDPERIAELRDGRDRTQEVDKAELQSSSLELTHAAGDCARVRAAGREAQPRPRAN